MADQNVRGRFIWHELATPDSESAHDFYADVLGWKKEAWELDPSYSMFAAASGPLGGAVELRNDGRPEWLPYIATEDIDATIREAQALGATLIQGATTIPNGSKYAILSDPHGARFAVYWPNQEPGPEKAADHGEFSWHELATADWRAAFDFYSRLFGWERLAEHDMGPMGVYLIFGRNGQPLGGMFNQSQQGRRKDAYWLGYVRVPNVHEAVEKVKSRGGSVVSGPMDVPGGDVVAQCIDPHGAFFALQTSAADLAARQEQGERKAAGEGISASQPVAEPVKEAAKRAARKTTSKKSAVAASASPPEAQKTSKKKLARTKASKKKTSAGKKTPKKKTATKRSAKKTAKKPARKKAGAKKVAAKAAGSKRGGRKAAGAKRGGKKARAKKRASGGAARRRGAKKAARKKAGTR